MALQPGTAQLLCVQPAVVDFDPASEIRCHRLIEISNAAALTTAVDLLSRWNPVVARYRPLLRQGTGLASPASYKRLIMCAYKSVWVSGCVRWVLVWGFP